MDEFSELEAAFRAQSVPEEQRVQRAVQLTLARELRRRGKAGDVVDAWTLAGWVAAPENPSLPRAVRRRQRASLERLGLSREFIERAWKEARAQGA